MNDLISLPKSQKELLDWLVDEFPNGAFEVRWVVKGFVISGHDGNGVPGVFTRNRLDALEAAGFIELQKRESSGVLIGYGVPRLAVWHVNILPAAFALLSTKTGALITSRSTYSSKEMTALLDEIDTLFKDDDIAELCFQMGIDYENISGKTKRARIRDLVDQMRRNNRLLALVVRIIKARPNHSWENVFF